MKLPSSFLEIRRIDNEYNVGYELYKNGKRIGEVYYDDGWVYNLLIYDKVNRKKGYGRLLMNILLSEFGHKKIELLADGDDECYFSNKDLVNFYRSLGFTGHIIENGGGVMMERKKGRLKSYKFKI